MRVTKADHPDELRRDRVHGEAEFIFGSRARPGWRGGQRRR
jgi:hypothetical protein